MRLERLGESTRTVSRISGLLAVTLLVFSTPPLLAAGGGILYCDDVCESGPATSTCGLACREPSGLRTVCYAYWESAFGINDFDGDTRINVADNCPCAYNKGQADCDGDGIGNKCDSLDAAYVRTARRACKSDKDEHVWGFKVEVDYEDTYTDASSCGAPIRYDRWRTSASCGWTTSSEECCDNTVENVVRDGHICPPNKDKACRADTWPFARQ